jgi:thymidylate kinase
MSPPPLSPTLRIAIVGACASGKSTLIECLRRAGYEARHVAQEHSFVPYMWQRIARPDLLIYLDVDHATMSQRRPWLQLRPEDVAEQARRLAHAREHCDLYIDTSRLTAGEVEARVLDFLAACQVEE